jgi:hypothetical protein
VHWDERVVVEVERVRGDAVDERRLGGRGPRVQAHDPARPAAARQPNCLGGDSSGVFARPREGHANRVDEGPFDEWDRFDRDVVVLEFADERG